MHLLSQGHRRQDVRRPEDSCTHPFSLVQAKGCGCLLQGRHQLWRWRLVRRRHCALVLRQRCCMSEHLQFLLTNQEGIPVRVLGTTLNGEHMSNPV